MLLRLQLRLRLGLDLYDNVEPTSVAKAAYIYAMYCNCLCKLHPNQRPHVNYSMYLFDMFGMILAS